MGKTMEMEEIKKTRCWLPGDVLRLSPSAVSMAEVLRMSPGSGQLFDHCSGIHCSSP